MNSVLRTVIRKRTFGVVLLCVILVTVMTWGEFVRAGVVTGDDLWPDALKCDDDGNVFVFHISRAPVDDGSYVYVDSDFAFGTLYIAFDAGGTEINNTTDCADIDIQDYVLGVDAFNYGTISTSTGGSGGGGSSSASSTATVVAVDATTTLLLLEVFALEAIRLAIFLLVIPRLMRWSWGGLFRRM